jgi:hypothetical protein
MLLFGAEFTQVTLPINDIFDKWNFGTKGIGSLVIPG